jgi:hypothetical protein
MAIGHISTNAFVREFGCSYRDNGCVLFVFVLFIVILVTTQHSLSLLVGSLKTMTVLSHIQVLLEV